ncbi:MAG: signal transduction histidine kinase [Lentimonas sp.]
MKGRTGIFFYILGGYVLLQFAWWAYHLIELTQINQIADKDVSRKVLMILSEGLVFFLIIIIGLWQIRKSIKKELTLSQRQNNFLLSVTHELKSPLAANKLFLQTLRKRKLNETQQSDILDKAIIENSRLELMIDNILNAARIEHSKIYLQKQEFSLNELIYQVTERFEKNLEFENISTQIEDELTVTADRLMIETILTNLIENAIKYGGDQCKIFVKLSRENNCTIIAVIDDGKGVDPSLEKDLFSKFVRSGNEETRETKGTGLGLYISREFAILNKAKLTYSKAIPKGSEFKLIFES